MSAQHTQGRLVVHPTLGEYVLKVGGEYIGGLMTGTPEDAARARRLGACWNLLLPFTTEQIEAFQADVLELAAQRDALLAALQRALPLIEDYDGKNSPEAQAARSAIANVTGKQP